MDGSALTPHARVRMQQRGIREAALDALLEYGAARYLHFRGREIVFFDKKARVAERLKRTYAIVGADGIVITVGHRYRRIPRD